VKKIQFYSYIQNLQRHITQSLGKEMVSLKFQWNIWERTRGCDGKNTGRSEKWTVFEKGGVNDFWRTIVLTWKYAKKYFGIKDADFFGPVLKSGVIPKIYGANRTCQTGAIFEMLW